MSKAFSKDVLFLRRRLSDKQELIAFCRMYGLSEVGTKEELEMRIIYFLKTGRRIDPELDALPPVQEIHFSDCIGENFFLDSAKHDFFREYVGERFSDEFIAWLEENPNSTYDEALSKYLSLKKNPKGL